MHKGRAKTKIQIPEEGSIMAIEKKSLISSTPAAKSTVGKLANTKGQ